MGTDRARSPAARGERNVRAELAALSEELRSCFRAWGEQPGSWSGGRFEGLALRAFELQWRAIPVYRGYCEARGAGPSTVADWRDIPPVPTAAFREADLAVTPPAAGDLVFRTSGTTRGPGRRGRHRVVEPELYRAALEPPFARFVLGLASATAGAGTPREPGRPEGAEKGAERERSRTGRERRAAERGALAGGAARPLVLSLVPPFASARDSSLSWMCDDLVRRFGCPGSRSVAGGDEPAWADAAAMAERCAAEDVPLCVLGTTLAVDAWLDRLEADGASIPLPEGSVLMDTGGAKGKAGLRRGAVVDRLGRTLGLTPASVVNEFGMTELLSQRYGRGEAGGAPSPPLPGPPWLRTRALDPVTLEPLPEGDVGVLCHLDLANAGSIVSILTEDLGRVRENVVEWIGRSPGAPPRGCSLATAELLEALG